MELPKDLANELDDELYSLMSQYVYNHDTTDEIVCALCKRRSPFNKDIKHSPDCLGVRLRALFAGA